MVERAKKVGDKITDEDVENITKLAYCNCLKNILCSLKFGSMMAYSEADILMAIRKEIESELKEFEGE